MNKNEAIKIVEQDKIQVARFVEINREVNAIQQKIEMVDYVPLETVINIFDKISEPQKPVIPKFVADFYESIKDDFENGVYNLCLQFDRDNGELSNELEYWFCCAISGSIQTLVKMKLYGYTVEKEKLYTVEIPDPNGKGINRVYLGKSNHDSKVSIYKGNFNPDKDKFLWLAEAEIRQDFDWAWQWAKEVDEGGRK